MRKYCYSNTSDQAFARLQETHARHSVLRQHLSYLFCDSFLPPELKDLVILIIARSSTTPQDQISASLLPNEDLPTNPANLGPSLSPHLIDTAEQLTRIALQQSGNCPFENLVSSIKELRKQLLNAEGNLRTRQLALATSARELLITQSEINSTAIHILETTKYSSIPRAKIAQASYLTTVAESAEAKLRLQLLEAEILIYSPEVKEAIANYKAHLGVVKSRFDERVHSARVVLEEFERAGGEELREIAAEKKRVRREGERIRGMMKRLGGDEEGAHEREV